MKYSYKIMTLEDAKDDDVVFVPNTGAKEAIQIWRWLSGLRPDFPNYKEASLLVVGIDEDAWLSPKEYRECYCPLTMTCIVRTKN